MIGGEKLSWWEQAAGCNDSKILSTTELIVGKERVRDVLG